MWSYLEVGSLQTWPNLNEVVRVGPDGITDSMDMSLSKFRETVKEMEAWCSCSPWGCRESDTAEQQQHPKMTGVLIQGGNLDQEADSQRADSVKTWGEKGHVSQVMHLLVREGQALPVRARSFKTEGRPFPGAVREPCSLQCLIWGLQPPALWDDKFLLFQATQFLVQPTFCFQDFLSAVWLNPRMWNLGIQRAKCFHWTMSFYERLQHPWVWVCGALLEPAPLRMTVLY